MKKILFTGGGGAGNEAIFRLLSDRYEVHLADADITAISVQIPSYACHEIPMANDSNFLSAITDLYERLNVDLLIPGVDEELLDLADQKGLSVFLPHVSYVETMLDKYKFAYTLKGKGIDVPATSRADEDWSFFPCIAKPRTGRGSRDVSVLKKPSQLAPYLELTGREPEEVILQEKMNGCEYTVLMAADQEARLHAIVPVRVDLKRGVTIRAEIDDNATVIEACRCIHEALPTRGCYNIQLIEDDAGRARPFEINPRISTTFCMSLAAGVDPIDIYLQNKPPATILTGRAGTTLKRFWTNHIKFEDSQE